MQIQTVSGYTLSAPGNSSASPKGFVAEELSPIQSSGAAILCEKCGLTINVGVIDRFEALISVDAARAFKPSPKAYQHACDRLGIERFKGKDLRNRLGRGSIDSSAMFLALRS
jgi:hypothetical protein